MAKTDETRLDQTTVSTDKTTNTASQQSDMPVLRLDDVSYSYTKGGKRVLKNISHDFSVGQCARHHRTFRRWQNHYVIADFRACQSHRGKGVVQRQRFVEAGSIPVP